MKSGIITWPWVTPYAVSWGVPTYTATQVISFIPITQPYLYSPDVDASVLAKSCMCMPNRLNNLEPVTSHQGIEDPWPKPHKVVIPNISSATTGEGYFLQSALILNSTCPLSAGIACDMNCMHSIKHAPRPQIHGTHPLFLLVHIMCAYTRPD